MTGTISPSPHGGDEGHFAAGLMPGFANPVLIPTFDAAETTEVFWPGCDLRTSWANVPWSGMPGSLIEA
ncbi:hypothetical protein F8E02_11080 [Methanoculleus sp. Wushi-C6]|uniref:Uncharacterized protein n=1 Tax=Methanoculleus caldifontis TaxID=2651577 RepID=A0ABU3X391_9EURY|nr:hypothetical protein [Methanoculleus sp. Wushi-C6]MDV2482532.1 hypothetical protein [Methanoculleus sp. Wushi-C6]